MGLEFINKEDEAKGYYRQLVKKFPDAAAAKQAAGALKRLEAEGKPFHLHGKDITGRTVDLQQYKGKTVLVYYWATWCGPCQAELPDLLKLYEKYKEKGFEVLSVSLDDTPEQVKEHIKQKQIPWVVLYEPGGLESPLALEYGIVALPAHFLIGPDGKVISRAVHVSQVQTELEKLFKK